MSLSPFIVPLIVSAIVLRRAMRAQKPQTVRTTRLWIFPSLLVFVTVVSLLHEGFPGFIAAFVFVAAGAAGGAIGWFRVHTLEFSVDKESGKVSARATQLGALLIVGLIALRYLVDYAVKQYGLNAGGSLVHATDATLIFTSAMLMARSVHTFIKARALIAAHRQDTLPAGVPPLSDRQPPAP